MPEEILENPVTGERMRILESTPETFKALFAESRTRSVTHRWARGS
jgi:hypothetical protein